ncbi:HEAT repeat domain-containing protein [Streptomyces sp. NPDC048417]|uniref:HEAT repeat domain-containing protein n=1 Tax=Streptomyces sp. NPDC048417 TaxID=3155387 RepID=UPI003441CF76
MERWPAHPDTRAALLRLACDPTPAVREDTAAHLGACWWEEQAARDTLALLAQDEHPSIREVAMHSVFRTGWQDGQARTVLLGLAQDSNPKTRLTAAGKLSALWPQTHAARDVLLELALDPDPGQHPDVRHRAVLGLLAHWLDDPQTRDALVGIVVDYDTRLPTTTTALAGILAHWLHDPLARTTVLRLTPEGQTFNRAQAEVGDNWHGDPGARDSVIRLSETDDAAVLNALSTGPYADVLHALSADPDAPDPGPGPQQDAAARAAHFRAHAVDMLQEGWAGDAVARDAVLQRVDDPSPHVRTRAGVALYGGWREDDAARRALDTLAQDHDEEVRGTITIELRWEEQNGTPDTAI